MFLFATCVRSFPECRCKNTQNNRNRQEPSQKKYKKTVEHPLDCYLAGRIAFLGKKFANQALLDDVFTDGHNLNFSL